MSIPQRKADNTEIDSKGIIRLILQFLKENSLLKAFYTLQNESGVHLNCFDKKETLIEDIQTGNLAKLLQICGEIDIDQELLFDVFEHAAIELLETGDRDAYDLFIQSTPAVFEEMNSKHSHRYRRLQRLRNKATIPTEEELWGAATASSTTSITQRKAKRRRLLAKTVLDSSIEAPPGRLLTLIGQAMRSMTTTQDGNSLAIGGVQYDIMRDKMLLDPLIGFNDPPVNFKSTIKLLNKDSLILCAAFSPDGRSFVTGDSGGEINIWLWSTGQLRLDLEYQKQDLIMSHQTESTTESFTTDDVGRGVAISALAFSHDGAILASGDVSGTVRVWQVATGKLGKKYVRLHNSAVTSISFHPLEPQILTSSTDQSLKLTHLRNVTGAGKIFSGHEGFIKAALFDGGKGKTVISGCDDGYVRCFATKNGERIHQFTIPKEKADKDKPPASSQTLARRPIRTIVKDGRHEHSYLFSAGGQEFYSMDTKGCLSQCYQGDELFPKDGQIISIGASKKCEWIGSILSNGCYLVYHGEKGSIEGCIMTNFSEGVGILYHPDKNIVAVWGKSNEVLIYSG